MSTNQISSEPVRFPTLFLTITMLVTGAVLCWFGWSTYSSYRFSTVIRERHFRIQELQGVTDNLDEVLTMSARMAAATGDLEWERRYLRFEPVLDDAVKEVIRLDPNVYSGAGVPETDIFNVKLIEIEHRAFELVRQNRLAEARAVLFSAEYEANKQIYAEGMAKVRARLKQNAIEALKAEHQRALINSFGVIVALPSLLVGWLVVLRTLRRWRIAQEESNRRLDQQARALSALNADLDGRVADRTAELQASQELLEKAKEAAEKANRSKSEFLANMSHEIRTPMNGIIGMTELALDTQLDRPQREYLEMVKASADSLLGVLNDILDFSKIEAKKLVMESIEFNLPGVLEDAMKLMAARAHEKGLELACRIPAEVPEILVGDPNRLRQIVVNLVSNAIKFTPAGEVVLQAELESQAENEACLHFTVADTGIGIPTEKQQLIFQPFAQADGSTTRRFGGTGLGLAIVSQLVEKMNGRIWVESDPGQGSTFHFTGRFLLPSNRQEEKTVAGSEAILRNLPVLVVDDNATNRRVLEELLLKWGMKPTSAASGPQALATLERANTARDPFPLVLLDEHMPGMDGFRVAEHLQQNPGFGGARIILLTSGYRKDAATTGNANISAYLTKPIRKAELFETVRNVLGAPPQPAALPSEHPAEEGQRGGVRILLAEDNPVNQLLAMRLLEKRGHPVVVAGNGREALLALEKTEFTGFDVILMDVQMPEMDGLAATAAIRAREKTLGTHIPIVAMTAHAMKGDRELCLASGMDTYIAKPIQSDELFAIIDKLAAPSRNRSDDAGSLLRSREEYSDRESFLARFGGDPELLGQAAELFLEDCPRRLRAIREAIEREDSLALERAAHALKGSIANFSVQGAFLAAENLEKIGKERELSKARKEFGHLEFETARLEVRLASWTARQPQ